MHKTPIFLMPEITLQPENKMPKDEKCVQLELAKGKNRSSPRHVDSTEWMKVPLSFLPPGFLLYEILKCSLLKPCLVGFLFWWQKAS